MRRVGPVMEGGSKYRNCRARKVFRAWYIGQCGVGRHAHRTCIRSPDLLALVMTLRSRLAIALLSIAVILVIPLLVAVASLNSLHNDAIALQRGELPG